MLLAIKKSQFFKENEKSPPTHTNTHIKYTVLLLFYLNIY